MQSISEVVSAMNICPIQNLETCNFIKMKNLSFFDRSIALSKCYHLRTSIWWDDRILFFIYPNQQRVLYLLSARAIALIYFCKTDMTKNKMRFHNVTCIRVSKPNLSFHEWTICIGYSKGWPFSILKRPTHAQIQRKIDILSNT